MYKLYQQPKKSGFKINSSFVGERIEERVNRMLYSGESIGDGAPLIYTDRRKGVQPEFNIRTDRFEMALDAINGIAKRTYENRKGYYETKHEPPASGSSVNPTA
jgi:hypothetical protein